ncbi:MAG: hypothetical protein ACRBBQ_06760 [Cognatishimia sp.]
MGKLLRQTLLRNNADVAQSDGGAERSAVERGLPMAFARAAERLLGLPLQVQNVKTSLISLDAITSKLTKDGMYLLLEGPAGATGAVIMDRGCLGALIEHLTMGRVLGKTAASTRVPTAVDAALMAPVLDGLLAECDSVFEAFPREDWAPQHRFGSMIEDCRTLVLSLACSGFSLFEITLKFADGLAEGHLQVLLPNALAEKTNGDENDTDNAQTAAFHENILLAPAEMRAILTKVTIPLERLQKLQSDEQLTFPASVLQNTILQLSDGQEIACAVLGQINGQRAVRVRLAKSDNAGMEDSESRQHETELGGVQPLALPRQKTGDTALLETLVEQPDDTRDTEVDDLDALTKLP